MGKQKMDSHTLGIGQLINERRYFAVPRHQRDYAWPIGSVEQFLNDVTSAMKNGDSDYFMGLIVLVDTDDPSSERYEILDGQQRLATTTMVYAAIRNWMKTNGFDDEGTKIQDQFIGISEIGVAQDELRIVLNLNNQKLFQEIVVNQCSDALIEKRIDEAGKHSSDKKLAEAAALCRRNIVQLAEASGVDKKDQSIILFRLAKYLRDNVQVTCLDVTEPENAYTVFESLNDRGIDLSVLDLLKNHVFRTAGHDNEAQIQNNWTTMIARLGDRKADDFLKVFWTSRYGRTQRGKLFHDLKKKYSKKQDVLDLSGCLADIAETYANIEVADSDLWVKYSEATRQSVRALSTLGGLQTHPIILASIERFTEAETERLLHYLITLTVRYQLVGRGRTGRFEITAAAVSAEITSGSLTSANGVWQKLVPLVPNDKEFRQDFEGYEETIASRARWLLRELEIQRWQQLNPGKAPQMAPLTDPNKVNLEHILPKKPDDSWKPVLDKDKNLLTECRDMIGNLCLLDEPSNKKEASRSFPDKIPTYQASDFILTRHLAEHFNHWDRTTIEARQKELAQLAVLAWPLQ